MSVSYSLKCNEVCKICPQTFQIKISAIIIIKPNSQNNLGLDTVGDRIVVSDLDWVIS